MTTMKVEFRDKHGWLADVQIVDDVVDATQAEQEARDRSPLGDRDDVNVTVTALPTMVEAA